MIHLAIGSTVVLVWVSSCVLKLKSNQKMVGYRHDICATAVSVGCQSLLESSQMVITDGYLFPPVACTAPSSTVKVSQLGEGLGPYQLDFIMLYYSSMWCLQGFTIEF